MKRSKRKSVRRRVALAIGNDEFNRIYAGCGVGVSCLNTATGIPVPEIPGVGNLTPLRNNRTRPVEVDSGPNANRLVFPGTGTKVIGEC